MSKLVLKGTVIVLGFALFFVYSYVYQNEIFTKVTLGIILNVISDISSLKEWAETADFYNIGLVINIVQASILSVIFGIFLWLALLKFKLLRVYSIHLSLGILLGFVAVLVLVVVPVILALFGYLSHEYLQPQGFLLKNFYSVYSWYLPFVIVSLFILVLKRERA